MKYLIHTLCAVLFLCTVSAIAYTAAEPPESVTIDMAQSFKPPVVFTHKKHVDDYKVLTGKCGECHQNSAGGGALKTEWTTKPVSLAAGIKHPAHTACKGCHAEMAKGPTACADCHK